MKLTSRGEYATRAVFFLAQHEGEGFLSVARLAKDCQMPRRYLEQILSELKAQGVLISREGARGGFRLARPAAELTIGEVVRILDGPMAPIGCVAGDPNFSCEVTDACGTKQFWWVLTQALDYLVDRVTFADLVANFNGERALFPEGTVSIPLRPLATAASWRTTPPSG